MQIKSFPTIARKLTIFIGHILAEHNSEGAAKQSYAFQRITNTHAFFRSVCTALQGATLTNHEFNYLGALLHSIGSHRLRY